MGFRRPPPAELDLLDEFGTDNYVRFVPGGEVNVEGVFTLSQLLAVIERLSERELADRGIPRPQEEPCSSAS